MVVAGENVVAQPFYSSASGEGTIPYPTQETSQLSAEVKKEGYQPAGAGWSNRIPGTFTFRLRTVGAAAPGRSFLSGLTALLSPSAPARKAAAAPPKNSQCLYLIDADGSNLRLLFSSPEYTACGSAEWSRDGKRIAFDAWRASQGEDLHQARILAIDADGGSLKSLGPGAMPSWSPDGRRIAFCQYFPENAVWTMNADGSESPTAGRRRLGRGVVAHAKRDRLRDEHQPRPTTVHLRRGHQGSPAAAGRQGVPRNPLELHLVARRQYLCFKGFLADDKWQIAAVHREGEETGFSVLLPNEAGPDLKVACPTLSWGAPQSAAGFRTGKRRPVRAIVPARFCGRPSVQASAGPGSQQREQRHGLVARRQQNRLCQPRRCGPCAGWHAPGED